MSLRIQAQRSMLDSRGYRQCMTTGWMAGSAFPALAVSFISFDFSLPVFSTHLLPLIP